MRGLFALLITATLFAAAPLRAEATLSPDPSTMPLDQLELGVTDNHPVGYFFLAIRKFEAGQKDEAVKWLYIGQIRWRLHIAAYPELPPDGDPALMASMMETIGRPINEWAGGDVDGLIRSMQAALEWDETNANGFTDTDKFSDEHRTVRAGLLEHIKYMIGQRGTIAEERTRNGLENRVIVHD